jgi:hypothetical protein
MSLGASVHVVLRSLPAILLAQVLTTASAAAERIPALAEPPPLVASDHPDLAARRADLRAKRDTLRVRVGRNQAPCAQVVAGSAQDAACAALAAAIRRHVAESKSFNATVEAAVRQAIGERCRALDGELAEMAAIDLKIVALEMEALGKLIRVPVGIWEEADEPPEDVLREAREHLERIASLAEEIDELNGKKAWSERQRDWAREHIYVASASTKYDVIRSVGTAHGQTDFASLTARPAFIGCEIGAKGRRYIPQYP